MAFGDTEVELDAEELLHGDEEVENFEEYSEEEDEALFKEFGIELEDADEDTRVLEKVAKPTSTADTSTTTTIKYAPVVKPVTGKYNLYCIAIDWEDTGAKPLKNVKRSGQLTAQVYKNLSRNNLELYPIAKTERVRYKAEVKNLSAAIAQAKKQAIAGQTNKLPNIFIMVTNDVGVSHGSGDTVRVRGTLGRDFLHEFGHSKGPQMLLHSGRRLPDGKVDGYGDGTCFMSSLPSTKLTAAQIYAEGWYPENQVAQYEGFEPVVYKIAKLDGPDIADAVKAVRIPREGKNPVFLSMPEVDPNNPKRKATMLTLHTTYGGKGNNDGKGTVRERTFANFAEYDNLVFETVNKTNEYWEVRVSPKLKAGF